MPSPKRPRPASRGRLGCGELGAFITDQCGAPRLCQLTDASSISWGRKLDDISDATVVVPVGGAVSDDCCECLARIEPWCHELQVFRNGVFVWGGPITEVTYGYDEVIVEAQDVLAWTKFRVPELTLDFSATPTFITNIAEQIIRQAFAEHDPCVVQHLQNRAGGDPVTLLPIPCLEKSAYEQLEDLSDGLLDFTVLGRSIVLTAENTPDKAITLLTDEMILSDIEFVKNGLLGGNRYFTRFQDDDTPAGCAPVDIMTPGGPCKCPAVSTSEHGPCTCVQPDGSDPCFSPLERILDVGAFDATTAQQFGDAHLRATGITPRTLDFGSGARLSPETPLFLQRLPGGAPVDGINLLVPGERIDVALTGLCTPIQQSYRIQEMNCTQDGSGEEAITVSLQLLDATN